MRYILSFILLLAVQTVCGVQPYRTEIFNPNVHTLQVRTLGRPAGSSCGSAGQRQRNCSFEFRHARRQSAIPLLPCGALRCRLHSVRCFPRWNMSTVSTGCRSMTTRSPSTPIATMCIIVSICPNDDMRFRVSGNYALPGLSREQSRFPVAHGLFFSSPRIWWPFRVR